MGLGNLLKIIELRGLQAAGKTTLSRELLSASKNLVRVNRDDLRYMLRGAAYNLENEELVVKCEEACAKAALDSGYNVVVDDTNLKGDTRWADVAKSHGAKYEVNEIKISVEESIRRDSLRENPVGPAAIRTTNKSQKS